MTVTVTPSEFTFVHFDAGVIERTVADLLDRLGMDGRDVAVEVDETSPIARVDVRLGDPLHLVVESGAFEDTRRPREMSVEAVVAASGRMLLRVRDRDSGRFDGAPADDDLSLAEMAAWDSYSAGRLARAGYPVNRQRWLYHFRNRHGFSDAADQAFDQLWHADGLSWDELMAVSARASTDALPA
jgi:hypothetical protein